MICLICYTENQAGEWLCRACSAPLGQNVPQDRMAVHSLPVTTVLCRGRYSIGKVLGRGGFGITYLASDMALQRPVAIKELFPEGASRQGRTLIPPPFLNRDVYERFIDQFLGEADLISRLHHPAIVTVYEAFEENDSAYMVMEYHPTNTLSAYLEKGALSTEQAVHCIEQIGAALEQIHVRGFLHRDIKPANVLYYPDGRSVLIDFGTAREFSANRTKQMTTQLTPGYAPLEQYSEKARRGPYTDIYALAGTLYHLLTGERPVSAADRVLGTKLPPVRDLNSEVSESLSIAVMHGLQMDVTKRPQNVLEFLDGLRGSLNGPVEESSPRVLLEEVPQPVVPVVDATPDDDSATADAGDVSPPDTTYPEREASVDTGSPPMLAGDPTVHCTGHEAMASCVSFTGDTDLLASCSFDGTIIWWNPRTGRYIDTVKLELPRNRLVTLACQPGGTGLLAGTIEGDVYVFSGTDPVPQARLAQGQRVVSIRYARHGHWGVLCTDHTLRLYQEQGRKEQVRIGDPAERMTCFDYSPDGAMLASGGLDGMIRLWDASAGRQLHQFASGGEQVQALVFSPDGTRLAGGVEQEIVIWETFSGQALQRFRHQALVRCLAFSPDGRFLASGADDHTARVWRLADEMSSTLSRHAGKVTAIAWSPTGDGLATSCSDFGVRVWWAHPEGSAAGQAASTPSMSSEKSDQTIQFRGHRSPVRAVLFMVDESQLVTAGEDCIIRIWNPTGRQVGVLPGHDGPVNCLAASGHGGLLASGSEDETVRVWHVSSGAELLVMRSNRGAIRSLAFSPRGRYLASGADDHKVAMWDLKKQSRLHLLTGHGGPVTSLAFSPDGKWLASASEDRTVRIYEAIAGTEVGVLTGHSSLVWSVMFSPDGETLATGSSDRTVRIWDRAGLKELYRMSGHKAPVRGLSYSPNGHWLASGGDDRLVILWDTRGKEIERLNVRGSVLSLSISGDGTRLAYACQDSVVHLIQIEGRIDVPVA